MTDFVHNLVIKVTTESSSVIRKISEKPVAEKDFIKKQNSGNIKFSEEVISIYKEIGRTLIEWENDTAIADETTFGFVNILDPLSAIAIMNDFESFTFDNKGLRFLPFDYYNRDMGEAACFLINLDNIVENSIYLFSRENGTTETGFSAEKYINMVVQTSAVLGWQEAFFNPDKTIWTHFVARYHSFINQQN